MSKRTIEAVTFCYRKGVDAGRCEAKLLKDLGEKYGDGIASQNGIEGVRRRLRMRMVRYAHLLGKNVELVYSFTGLPGLPECRPKGRVEGGDGQEEQRFGARVAGTELFACGVLLGCGEEFILMEQRADQFGSIPRFALKIPHSWILRLGEDDRESRIPVVQRPVRS